MSESKCIIPSCASKGPVNTFKSTGVNKLIQRASERGDEDFERELKTLLDAKGDLVELVVHKSCYCSYTSKQNTQHKKRKNIESVVCEPPMRLRHSSVDQFDFKMNCLLCNEICKGLDPKHPERWDKVCQCEVKGLSDTTPFREVLLDLAEKRNDQWGRNVALRISNAYDLGAAEAQYHVKCYDQFRKIPPFVDSTPLVEDKAMKTVIEEVYAKQKTNTWTSVELYNMYIRHGGILTQKQMFSKLVTQLGEDIVVENITGCEPVVGLRQLVRKTLKLVESTKDNEDREDEIVRKVLSEAHSIKKANNVYDLGEFTREQTIAKTSKTLLRLISKLVSSGETTKKSLSIAQSIQSQITNIPNQTTLGLGIKLHHTYGSRDLIDTLHDQGYIASYEEVLRFRKSAALYVAENSEILHNVMGMSRRVGLIFGWFDNLDMLVSTPNGRRETHAMAIEFQNHPAGIIEMGPAQPCISRLKIPRLSSKQAKQVGKNRSVNLEHYTGPKKVVPPAVEFNQGIPFTELLLQQRSLAISQDKDVKWLNSIKGDNTVEWNGFNSKLAREDSDQKAASTYMFGPLIDAPPSHPDTVLTTLIYMQKTLLDFGMKYAHVYIDMQLFAITKQIVWNDTENSKTVIAHPGSMHIIMLFCSCIGKLVKGSGIEVFIGAAYGGLKGIMNGKSWVRALRAYRSVAAALLKSFLSTGRKTFDDIMTYLEEVRKHPTGRHWVDNFLVPTLLVHQFVRAEREGDFYFQQFTLKRMLKYFFIAGHVQYARYLAQYLLEMRALPDEAKQEVASGAFLCRHNKGHWNGVSSDQFGEQTAIRIGKGSLKGMTLRPELVHVADRVEFIYSQDPPVDASIKQHKEELPHRRHVDSNDRKLVSDEVNKYLHPLNSQQHQLFNVVSGQIAPSQVNVAEALTIGETMEMEFINKLPNGFHDPISSPIKTMEMLKTNVKTKPKSTLNLETLFLRILLLGQQRHLELRPMFNYELCSVPPALIDENGCLRKGNKSGLVKHLGVLVEPSDPDIIIVDVSQLLYRIVWPHGGDVSSLVASIETHLKRYPATAERILVFDKYNGVSAKDHERVRRSGDEQVDYCISVSSKLPKRDTILKNKNNKRQLSAVMSSFNILNTTMETHVDEAYKHDEADITIISYVLQAAESGKAVIRVLSDDTDVFVLLVYWVWRTQIQARVQMERWDHTILDVNAT